MNRIKKMSSLLSMTFNCACIIYPILNWYIVYYHLEILTSKLIELPANISTLTNMQYFMIFIISCIPVSIAVFICHRLAKLFRLYANGVLFDLENTRLIKSIGLLIILGELLDFIYQPLMTIALTSNNPVGQRIMAISFGTTNLSAILTGLIILVASWIVKEAQLLQTESRLTI